MNDDDVNHISREDIYKKITSNDKEILEKTLIYLKEKITEDNERIKNTENKATTILGFSGLVSSFMISFGKLLFDVREVVPQFWFIIYILFYVSTVMLLILTIFEALNALLVRTYFSWFHLDNIYEFQDNDIITMLKNWITTLSFSIDRNMDPINDKVSSLKEAQKYFTYGIIFILLDAIIMSIILIIILFDP